MQCHHDALRTVAPLPPPPAPSFRLLQIKEECFLEDINNILQSGEVPNLYAKDEVPQVLDGIRKPAKQAGVDETAEALWAFFVDR